MNERVEASARYFEVSRDLLCTACFDGYMAHLNGTLGADARLDARRAHVEAVPGLRPPRGPRETAREAALVATGYFTASFTNRYRTKAGDYRWIEWSSKADTEGS